MVRDKSLEYRLSELSLAIRALTNASEHFNKTKDEAYLLDVMGRLRALVAFGGPTMNPLLLDLADEREVALEMYSTQPKPQKAPDGLLAHAYGSKTWAVYPSNGMQKYELRDWLNAPAYYVDSTKNFRSRNQIIKHLANKQGGSHYDKKIVAIVDSLSRITGSRYNGVQFFLMDISCLVVWFGLKLPMLIENKEKGMLTECDERITNLDKGFNSVQISIM